MKISLQIPVFTWPGGPEKIGPTLSAIARTAEDAGFHSVWVMDHYFQLAPFLGPVDAPMLEGYSALSFIAGVTERIHLGTMVTGVIYRHPGYLVKVVTTLDVLSGGRAWLGIGAGWYEREALGMGFPYPSTKERFEHLEDALQMAHHIWGNKREPFVGKHVHALEPLNNPPPLSQPHPRILVGGSGEKKTLRMAAQYGDAVNFFARIGPEAMQHKLDILKEHCETMGRNYDEIERTVLSPVNLAETSPAQVVATCRALAGLGIQHYIISLPDVHELEPLRVIGREVVPAVAEL